VTLLLRADSLVHANSNDRPCIRLYSDKARKLFYDKLENPDWRIILATSDVNTAYSLFSGKIQKHFNDTFPLVNLSRKRASDKNGLQKV